MNWLCASGCANVRANSCAFSYCRAFADFLVGSVVLHFFVFNFRKPSWPYYAPDAALWDNPDTADFLYAQWGNL